MEEGRGYYKQAHRRPTTGCGNLETNMEGEVPWEKADSNYWVTENTKVGRTKILGETWGARDKDKRVLSI